MQKNREKSFGGKISNINDKCTQQQKRRRRRGRRDVEKWNGKLERKNAK